MTIERSIKRAVFYQHVFLSGTDDSRKRCISCKRQLYYEGSVRWSNGDQANFFACDCEHDGQRRHVTMTRCEEWNPLDGVTP